MKRRANDLAAAGMTINGASDIVVSGNIFASVRPKAVELTGDPARRVVFANNVLTDVESDHGRLQDSVIRNLVVSPADESPESEAGL